jgi:hypothetical protein
MTISMALRKPWLPRSPRPGVMDDGQPRLTRCRPDVVLSLAVLEVKCWRSAVSDTPTQANKRTSPSVLSEPRVTLNYKESPV